ncbi:MAG TPA: hypothetical protein DCW46_09915 [Desulfotomaculum sp.]|nr:MAG: Phenylacetate--CoA ligase [Parcubacteria bacterium 33_209]HAU32546.1 hypothetical protein [Desulfotomaculum sp.]
MKASSISFALESFLSYNYSPAMVKRAAGIVGKMIDKNINSGTLNKIQNFRLSRFINYLSKKSPFYRNMFNKYQINPSSIHSPSDLRILPFTTSNDLRKWERFFCVKPEQFAAVFTTSGTTGEPKRIYYTCRELQTLTNLYAVFMRISCTGRLIVLIALPMSHGLWIGSASAMRAVERAGGLPLPVGANNSAETIQWMKRFKPNILISSPSYMTSLTWESKRINYQPVIEKVFLGRELLSEDQRELFSEYWRADVFDTYGSTEIGSAQTISLPGCNALHLNDFDLVTEIIDPVTNLPADEGELVFSTISREGMPLLRYKSGDRARWETCRCEFPLSSVRLLGRTDDMIVAGDMNLYGRIVKRIIARIPGSTGKVAIKIDKIRLMDRLTLQIEGTGIDKEDVVQKKMKLPLCSVSNRLIDIAKYF